MTVLTLGESERDLYMQSVPIVVGIVHEVDRNEIFQDVVDLYTDGGIVGEYPIFVQYKGEKGIDDGGLRRDMYTAFWDKTYSLLFEGAKTLVPMVHPQITMSYYSILGRIISHGYLATGILPDRIALPTLLMILFGPDVCISTTIMMDSFMDFISATERQIMKMALKTTSSGNHFPPKLLNELTSVLSRFGCRQIPKPSSLIHEVERLATYEFCTKPAAAITLMNSGLAFRDFWTRKHPDDVYSLHSRLAASSSKIISIMDIGSSNPSEERVGDYLTTMLGNMPVESLRLFLRFVTGASVLITSKITVTFNNLSGLGRRPIAHTCSYLLELPTSYANYDDFATEFKAILSSTENEFAWRMDAV